MGKMVEDCKRPRHAICMAQTARVRGQRKRVKVGQRSKRRRRRIRNADGGLRQAEAQGKWWVGGCDADEMRRRQKARLGPIGILGSKIDA